MRPDLLYQPLRKNHFADHYKDGTREVLAEYHEGNPYRDLLHRQHVLDSNNSLSSNVSFNPVEERELASPYHLHPVASAAS